MQKFKLEGFWENSFGLKRITTLNQLLISTATTQINFANRQYACNILNITTHEYQFQSLMSPRGRVVTSAACISGRLYWLLMRKWSERLANNNSVVLAGLFWLPVAFLRPRCLYRLSSNQYSTTCERPRNTKSATQWSRTTVSLNALAKVGRG